MLCYTLKSLLVVFVYLIIELLTRSTVEILNKTINLSKLNIFNSFRSALYILQYCSVSTVSDRFIWTLEKLYVINVIFPQVQKLFFLRKQILVYNVSNVCMSPKSSLNNNLYWRHFTIFEVQSFALFISFHHFTANWYSKKWICRITCCNTKLDHSSKN